MSIMCRPVEWCPSIVGSGRGIDTLIQEEVQFLDIATRRRLVNGINSVSIFGIRSRPVAFEERKNLNTVSRRNL